MRYSPNKTKSIEIDFSIVFERVASDCDLDQQTIRYCLDRLKVEGITFWTKTLPKLAKSILYSIECGIFTHNVDKDNKLTDFAWKGRSLRYFRSLLSKIFDVKSGILLPNPCASALLNIRQLVEYVYKLALDFDDTTITKAEDGYEAIQKEVGLSKTHISFERQVRKNAETYYPGLFRASIDQVFSFGPRFGPGSFGVFGPQSRAMRDQAIPFYEWKQLPDEVINTCDRSVSAHSGYFKPYPSSKTKIVVGDEARVASVLFVPKDSRGPRVISKEPLHVLKPQMAFLSWATAMIEEITNHRVNFADQSINQSLAMKASIDRKNATLDLKEASDRVKFTRMLRLFRNSPAIYYLLTKCRSSSYKLPSGKTGTMHALAGMGSGLTFPLLALSIHLSICTYVSMTLRIPYMEVADKVYVYGDDVILPSEWFDLAKHALELFGLKLNVSKSYKSSCFRESCGGDYLAGKSVSPVRLKLQNCGLPGKLSRNEDCDYQANLTLKAFTCVNRKSPKREHLGENLVLQLAKHCVELRKSQRFATAEYYESILSSVIPMPYVGDGSPVLGVYTEDTMKIVLQGSKRTADGSTYTVKGVSSVPRYHNSSRTCPYKFMASFLKRSTVLKPSALELGSSSSGATFGEIPIPRAVKLKLREFTITQLLPVPSKKTVVLLGSL